MKSYQERRKFIKSTALALAGLGIAQNSFGKNLTFLSKKSMISGTRAGIIGLDTSHSVEFTKVFNSATAGTEYGGFKIVAAYPYGSKDIKSSFERIPGYIEDVKKMGVEITGSIDDMLKKVDVVFLETNDGRLHLEQALRVFKAGKPLFIDKPVAASLKDAVAIFEAAEKYQVPVFSSSSLRYSPGAQEIAAGKVGKVMGADTFSPCKLESSHPDLFWYGIHGVELLFTVMGTGCKEVIRVNNTGTDVVIGTWEDGRIGTFRGLRSGKDAFGGTVFGEMGVGSIGDFTSYNPLLLRIVDFFRTGIVPVSSEETLEIYAFMEAADKSKRKGGVPVSLASMFS